MEKMAIDAVDTEICRKLRELMATNSFQIESTFLESMIRKPESTNIENIPEELQPFFRHYLFMMRRDKRKRPDDS